MNSSEVIRGRILPIASGMEITQLDSRCAKKFVVQSWVQQLRGAREAPLLLKWEQLWEQLRPKLPQTAYCGRCEVVETIDLTIPTR